MTGGKVFFVDGNDGSGTNSGLNASYPTTLANAYANCVSGRGDVIALIGKSFTVSGTLVILKDGVSIVSLPAFDVQTGSAVGLTSSAGAIFQIQASKVRLENLRLTMESGGGAIVVSDTGESVSNIAIKNVEICLNHTDADGIEIRGTMLRSTIEDVKIDLGDAASADAGIDCDGSVVKCLIQRVNITGALAVGMDIDTATSTIVRDCVVMGATKSYDVTGTSSCVVNCASDVATAGTAPEGGFVTIA
jgi:hypothetical protein